MTYSESAEGLRVTLPRCIQELRKHGLGDDASVADFAVECWGMCATFNHGDDEGAPQPRWTVDATDLLNWLGY